MIFSCFEATTRLNSISQLHKQFLKCLELAGPGATTSAEARVALEQAKQYRADLETGIQELSYKFPLEITVSDAVNPYVKALKVAGIRYDHPECADKKEMTFDSDLVIERQCARYAEHGMIEWTEDIQSKKDILIKTISTPEEIKKIEARIKIGMVPIVMPGRQIQMQTWGKTIENLLPVYISHGRQNLGESSSFNDLYLEKMNPPPFLDGTQPATFFNLLPDRPYLVWVKPEDKVEEGTQFRTFDKLKQMLDTMHQTNPDLVDVIDLTPLEYMALQFTHTNFIHEYANGYVDRIDKIEPIDGRTLFLSAGCFSDNTTPAVDINLSYGSHGSGQVFFCHGGEGNDTGGIRTVARS